MNGDSLYRFVDTSNMRCMNESEAGSCRNCIRPFDGRRDSHPFFTSFPDDPELILEIPFTEVVNIKSFALVGNVSLVKLFVNRDDVDFSSGPAAQEVELIEDLEAQYAADYPLKPHLFNSVSSVTVFVASSFDGDASRISFLGFKGSGTGINYRDQVEVVYEARAPLKGNEPSRSIMPVL